jgi:hypothetical protein
VGIPFPVSFKFFRRANVSLVWLKYDPYFSTLNSSLTYFKLIFAVLQSQCDDTLDIVIAVIERYTNIWVAMDIMNEIGEELFKKHQALRSEHKHCRSLFTLLGSLSSTGFLPESAHHQIESEVAFITQVGLVSFLYTLCSIICSRCIPKLMALTLPPIHYLK